MQVVSEGGWLLSGWPGSRYESVGKAVAALMPGTCYARDDREAAQHAAYLENATEITHYNIEVGRQQ